MIKQFGIYRVVNHFSKNLCNKSMDQTIEASESVLTNQNIMQAKRLNVNTSWQAHACCWWFDVKFHLSDTDSDAYSHLKSPYNDTFGWQHHYIIVMLYMSCFSLSRSLALSLNLDTITYLHHEARCSLHPRPLIIHHIVRLMRIDTN